MTATILEVLNSLPGSTCVLVTCENINSETVFIKIYLMSFRSWCRVNVTLLTLISHIYKWKKNPSEYSKWHGLKIFREHWPDSNQYSPSLKFQYSSTQVLNATIEYIQQQTNSKSRSLNSAVFFDIR